jgi:glutamate N-acetyltransferase/amino-acid N-acetyltransferase
MILGPGIFRTLLPNKFLAGGINCGVRQYRPDLGIIISEIPSVGVAMYTQNTHKAAPILHCENILPRTNIKAIITNSGQANAATGEQGIKDNDAMVNCVAANLSCLPEQVLTASTGVIGTPLAVDKITAAIPELINNTSNVAEKFALAILTTDLVPKTVAKEVNLSAGKIHITGICKGSGMIHPNMATMLGYLLTDAALHVNQAKELLHNAVNKSFNMISVDGETSTNDCVFMLANGASGVHVNNQQDFALLQTALNEVAMTLAKSIARDGEGATKLIEVHVKGAPDNIMATSVARNITVSPLIKTAIHGESPNWGRIIAKLGAEKIPQQLLSSCSILFQQHMVYSKNKPQDVTAANLKAAMRADTINLVIDFDAGIHEATAWGCDLSEKYVKINAEYLS